VRRDEVCMVFDESGNAFDCFDYTAEALEAKALELRRLNGEVTTITYGPSPFVLGGKTMNAGRVSDGDTSGA